MPGSSSDSSDAQNAVSEDQLTDLEAYAEKQRQDDETDALLERTPPLVERGGIYLIGVTVIVTLALLYLGRVNELVTAPGRLWWPSPATASGPATRFSVSTPPRPGAA
jgi:hypothetical protein